MAEEMLNYEGEVGYSIGQEVVFSGQQAEIVGVNHKFGEPV